MYGVNEVFSRKINSISEGLRSPLGGRDEEQKEVLMGYKNPGPFDIRMSPEMVL